MADLKGEGADAAVTAIDPQDPEHVGTVLRLLQMTAKAKAGRFTGTAVAAEQLTGLAAFLSDIANLKSSQATEVETIQ